MDDRLEAMSRELEAEYERLEKRSQENNGGDLWPILHPQFDKDLREFKNALPFQSAEQLGRLKDHFIREWGRTYEAADAGKGLRGQGGVVKSIFKLDDSIQALDAGSTKLGRRMYWLTIAITVMTAVMVIDILVKWVEIASDRLNKKPLSNGAVVEENVRIK
jgi:hypothetical protein